LAAAGIDVNGGLINVYQFDQVSTLSLLATLPFVPSAAAIAFSVKWCPSCDFLAVGGQSSLIKPFLGIIQIYSFDSAPSPTLQPVGHLTTTQGTTVNSIDWCPECSYLAAGGIDDSGRQGIIQVYSFDGENLTAADSVFPAITRQINSIKWCTDCHYLAAGGDDYLAILGFDPAHPANGLTELYSVPFLGAPSYQSVDVCSDCSYIAAGGLNSTIFESFGVIDIYHFDANSTQSLTRVARTEIQADNGAEVVSLKWCQGCNNLAVVAKLFDAEFHEIDILQLYHFDAATEKLSRVQTYTLKFLEQAPAARNPVALVDWCGNCCNNLAAGSQNEDNTAGLIYLFKGNDTCLTAPTNLKAQKIYHRFPTQTNIINKLCWDSVAGAVAYNVYANANLTILLATITNPPLCYSQHQVCKGKSTTYYVTAINASGTQSKPALVTI